MMTAPHRPLMAALGSGGLCLGLAGLLFGCIPAHAEFLRVGVTFPDGPPADLVILDVPLAQLQAEEPDLDLTRT